MIDFQSIEHKKPMQGSEFKASIDGVRNAEISKKYRLASPLDHGFVDLQSSIAMAVATK